MKKYTIIFVILALILFGVVFYYFNAPEVVAPVEETGIIPIENEFPGKIVYTADMSFDKNLLVNDCKKRGGEFNECGSTCSLQAELCAAVCAYTCEFPEPVDFGEPEEFTAETTQLEAVGEFSGDGIATREFDGLSFIHTITAKLNDPSDDKFYEGWLVEKGDFFSTGKLEKAGAGYALTYTNEEDKSEYNTVVITLETLANGLDNNPEAHVLEGNFLTE